MGVIGHLPWEVGGRIPEIEGHGFLKDRPLRWIEAVDGGFDEGLVAFDLRPSCWKSGGVWGDFDELGLGRHHAEGEIDKTRAVALS